MLRRPRDPIVEKEFVIELMLRRQAAAPETRKLPYGPPGTEWSVVQKAWLDDWRLYVGHKRTSLVLSNAAAMSAEDASDIAKVITVCNA